MSEVRIEHLRCEYLVDPEGIDEKFPRFSWELVSKERGTVQTAYQILVASDPAHLKKNRGAIWNSGMVKGDQTNQVLFNGRPLQSFRKYFWKVRVWTGSGTEPSEWSPIACWSMGILKQKEWKGTWIGYSVANLHDAPFFRNEIRITKKIRRAVLYATARGLYEAHINGEKVARDIFTPGWTDYSKRIYYNAYDVTGQLKKGRNVIGAVIGEGWFKGPITWENRQNIYGKQTMFLANLRVEFSDGTSRTFSTDKTWKTSTGPILRSTFLWGEVYDRRMALAGWDQPGYSDASWQEVKTFSIGNVPLQAYPNEPVRRTEILKARKVWQAPKGSWVFDFGQNFAGRVKIRVREKAGTVLQLRFGEMVRKDKTLYVENLRTAWSTDTYICSGNGVEEWEPRFTFHGFQYAEITGISKKPGLSMLTGVVTGSDTPRSGKFSCSNPLINRLYENTVWTQRANFLEVPTDCPQRDERLGWTGDAQAYIRTAAANMDIAAFFKKWMRDLEDTQKESGAVTNVAPSCVLRDADADAGWGDALVICPWVLYQVYGDRRILSNHFPAMKKWVEYLKKTSNGLVRGSTHTFGDWLSINADTPKPLVQTAFFAHAADLTSRTARVIGKKADAKKYQALYKRIAAAFTRTFAKKNGRIEGDTQTGYILALHFDLLPEALRPNAVKHLVADIRKKKNHLSTGFLGTPYLLHVLERFGHADLAYTLLTNTTYPSWLYPVTNGATTIWERWNGWTREHGFGDTNMNSFSHYAYGAVGEWLFKRVAGIDLATPGFRSIEIRPLPGGKITRAQAEYKSISGMVRSEWKLSKSKFILDVTIPANTHAQIHVPATQPDSVTESGVPIDQADGVTAVQRTPEGIVARAGSGRYRFQSVNTATQDVLDSENTL